MEYSQYCLGKLQGETFNVTNRKKVGIDKNRFDAILSYIHEKNPEELNDILIARRFYFFNGNEKDVYRKFIRWVLRQENGNLSKEQLYAFDKLLKKGNYHSLRNEEFGLIRDIIYKYYPPTDCIYCNTDHTSVGQYELYPLHHLFGDDGDCFWTGAPPHIWQDPMMRPIFETHEELNATPEN